MQFPRKRVKLSPKQTRLIVTVGLAGAAFILAASVIYIAVALPGCGSCHLQGEFGTQTQSSPHSSVECVSCHVDTSRPGRIAFATTQYFHVAFGLVPDRDRTYAAVPDERCTACHEGFDKGDTLESNGIKIKHGRCAEGSLCSDCHSTTAHGTATTWPRTIDMDKCFGCHGQTNKKTDCDVCHTKGYDRQAVTSGPFRITHGPQWKNTHGMGDMKTCVACHEEEKCAGCHGVGVPHANKFIDKHAQYSIDKRAKCTGCHREDFCADCHAYPMPHSTEFVLNHADTVKTDGTGRCETCHAPVDCKKCHEDHVHPVTKEQMQGFMLKETGSGGDEQ